MARHHHKLRFESLEDRRMLTQFVPPSLPGTPVVVAPPEPGLSPIMLPPGLAVTPPDATVIAPPSPGQLPAGLGPVVGAAETTAAALSAAYLTNHPGAVVTATDVIGQYGTYTMTVSATSGLSYFSYTVVERAGLVEVAYGEFDAGTFDQLAAVELSAVVDVGALLFTQSSGGVTQVATETSLNGSITSNQTTATNPWAAAAAELVAVAAIETVELEAALVNPGAPVTASKIAV